MTILLFTFLSVLLLHTPAWAFDETHLKKLQAGGDCPKCDLSEADLTYAVLTKADLKGADLTGANLTGAYLLKATLSEANLTGANLYKAYLFGAYLYKADLTEADLTYAVLTKADLTQANLTGVTLTGADLTGANLTQIILPQKVKDAKQLAEQKIKDAKWLADENKRRLFLDIVSTHATNYASATNEMKKSLQRKKRAHAFQELFEGTLSGKDFHGWEGSIQRVETDKDGDATVAIAMPGFTLSCDTAKISLTSGLFDKVAGMDVGDTVRVSGKFLKHPETFTTGWYLHTLNATEARAMTSPVFMVQYVDIIQAPSE